MKRLLVALIIIYAVLGPVSVLGQTKRNPFAPLAKTAIRQMPQLLDPVENVEDSQVVELKLNGILFSKKRPVAIINDTVVEIGSLIAGRKIVEISISNVVLQYYDKKETLEITPKFLFTISGKKRAKSDIQNNVTK